jgi:hypothetical protein
MSRVHARRDNHGVRIGPRNVSSRANGTGQIKEFRGMFERKRRTVQPMLESMESRVVPSAMGVHAHPVRDVSAVVGSASGSTKELRAAEQKNASALKELAHQQAVVHSHSLEHIATALPTAAEQAASQISNIFKSIGQSL